MSKSRTIAVPIEILSRLVESTSLRSVKAMLIPYTQIWWGHQDDLLYLDRFSPEISIDIAWFAKMMGQTISPRITTEIRKIYRKMNEELFPVEESSEIAFSYQGTTKDKKRFVLNVHRPELLYNLAERGSFVCMSADDVFRCENIYDFRVLAIIASAPEERKGCLAIKDIKLNTYFLKYVVFNMSLYQGCYVNKMHPQYDQTILDTIEYYFEMSANRALPQEECIKRLDWFAHNNGYKNYDNLMKVLGEIVTFNKRSRMDAYLEHGLEIVNQGKMFRVVQSEDGKLFQKIRKAGYRIDHYKISVIQNYKI